MTRISIDCGAINLAQGFPDFDPPEAMMDTIFALTNPGDKIVMFSSYFENYRAQTIVAGCGPVFVPLTPSAFGFDPEALEDAFRQHPKAILICNPSNPSGKVFSYEELKLISELCIRCDVYVIMDEVYEHIVYEGHKHTYMSTLPGMRERTVCSSSLSKIYSITGWRLGYALAPQNIMKSEVIPPKSGRRLRKRWRGRECATPICWRSHRPPAHLSSPARRRASIQL